MHILQKCRQECLKQGMDLNIVWLSDNRPEEAHLYCNEDYLRKFKGFIFLACKVSHPLLTYVQSQKHHYVHITHELATSFRVGVDYEHGLKLALDQLVSHGHERLMVFYLSDIREVMEKVTASYSIPIELIECRVSESLTEYEIQGYQRMRELAIQDRLAKGILITDDILARGATRALLEKKPTTCRDLDILIMVGRQEIIPLGVQVSYAIFDIEEQARQTVKILNDQINGQKGEQDFFVGHYKLLSESSQPKSVSLVGK
jgi:DNA-binding LacI/PurR family transcriptional regulator